MVRLESDRDSWSEVQDPETDEYVALDEDVDREVAERLVDEYDPLSFADDADADTAEAEDTEETPDSVDDAPFDPRDDTIAELSDELDDRDLDDDQLDALAQAERDTQDREGALDTIDDHREGAAE